MKTLICTFIVLFCLQSNAKALIVINDINPNSVYFAKRGPIPMGPLEMYFRDYNGQEYIMNCGGDLLQLKTLRNTTFSNLEVKGIWDQCFAKIQTLKELDERGANLYGLEITLKTDNKKREQADFNAIELLPIYSK